MELLIFIIAFLVCYFHFDFSWWVSLLIAFGAPIAVGLVVWVVGLPFIGISTLIEKIKERRQKPYPEQLWRDTYQVVEQEEDEIFFHGRAESFIMYMIDKGIRTRAGLNEQGEAFGYPATTISRALTNLLDSGELEIMARGVYSRGHGIPAERPMLEEASRQQIRDAERVAAMMLEIEKQRKRQSNTFGIWSLVLGIIGIFTFPVPVLAIAAIILAALQFRRHTSKCSIAGLVLGIVGVALFAIEILWLGYESPYPLHASMISATINS